MLVGLLGAYPECETYGDLSGKVLGPKGAWVGQAVQQGNFFLFLPVALLACASGAQGLLDPDRTGAFGNCDDYWILSVAGLCLAFTQFRRLDALENFSFVSAACVAAVAALAVATVLPADLRGPPPSARAGGNDDDGRLSKALLFGNPDMFDGDSAVRLRGWGAFALGLSLAVWSYVPSFLTVELLYAARHKRGGPKRTVRADFPKAIALSAALSVLLVCGVGEAVVWGWGWDVADPLTLGPNPRPGVWRASSAAARALNACWLVSSFLSYALDSIPLGHAAVRRFGPGALPPSALIVGRSGGVPNKQGKTVALKVTQSLSHGWEGSPPAVLLLNSLLSAPRVCTQNLVAWVGDLAASLVGVEPLWGREAGLGRFGGDDDVASDDGHISDPFDDGRTSRRAGATAGSDGSGGSGGGGGSGGCGQSSALRGIYGSGVGYHGASVARPVTWRRFLLLTLPPWLLGLAMALLIPSLPAMICVATAATVPAASLLLPATLYYAWLNAPPPPATGSQRANALLGAFSQPFSQPLLAEEDVPTPQRSLQSSLEQSAEGGGDHHGGPGGKIEHLDWAAERLPGQASAGSSGSASTSSLVHGRRAAGPFTMGRACDVALVLVAGLAALLICALAAVAKIAIPDLRGPLRIGCKGWLLLSRG